MQKKLKNLIELSSNVKIYVPSTVNAVIIDRTLSELSGMFGGATKFDAIGCWQSQQAGLVKEKITICQSYCNEEQLKSSIEKVIEICENLKSEMSQEAISLEVNNRLYFV